MTCEWCDIEGIAVFSLVRACSRPWPPLQHPPEELRPPGWRLVTAMHSPTPPTRKHPQLRNRSEYLASSCICGTKSDEHSRAMFEASSYSSSPPPPPPPPPPPRSSGWPLQAPSQHEPVLRARWIFGPRSAKQWLSCWREWSSSRRMTRRRLCLKWRERITIGLLSAGRTCSQHRKAQQVRRFVPADS